MSMDYLEDLESRIDSGEAFYACPGGTTNEWFISKDLQSLEQKAQRTANGQRFEAHVYRLTNCRDATAGDSFLAVRNILEPGARGEAHLRWILVDTRDAAEMLRDVSQGPSPYFGAVIESTFRPQSDAGRRY